MPTQTCTSCCHWEPISERGERHIGQCRKFALAPRYDGWPITEGNDWCEEWSGMGVFKGEDGTYHRERRSSVRAKVDCPVVLRLPSGDRSGHLADISERGARVRLSNPPLKGALAMLRWGPHEYFCTIAWASTDTCGVTFDKPISRKVFLETTDQHFDMGGTRADSARIALGRRRTRRRFAR